MRSNVQADKGEQNCVVLALMLYRGLNLSQAHECVRSERQVLACLGCLVSYRPLASGGVARCLNRDDEGKLEVIYKNRWEGILGVVLGLGDGRASRRRRADVL